MVNQSALLAHIISQTRANIDFLASQDQISLADARFIISKLPSATDSSVLALADRTQNLAIMPLAPNPAVAAQRAVPPPRQAVRVRAIWGWNQDAQDPNDLSFREGDVFEIVDEANPDWWTGRHNGKQGIFPSNYVERINASSSPAPYNEKPPQERNYSSPGSYNPQYPPPSGAPPPFMAPPAPYQPPSAPYQPPPQQVGYNPYLSQPPGNFGPPPPQQQQQQQQQQQPPDQPPKKSKFGGLGNTLAQSAAGGLGFGAGSAIGGDLIHAIF